MTPSKTTIALRKEIQEHLATYDVRPDMRRPLADVLEALIHGREEKAAMLAAERTAHIYLHPAKPRPEEIKALKRYILVEVFPTP